MSTGLGREMVQSKFRWAPLLSAAAAAAVHAQDISAETISWAETTLRVEQTARILFPVLLVFAAWEALRSRRFGLAIPERTAVRSMVSIRSGQYTAVLLWTLIAALAALGVGLLVSAGAHGIHGAAVLPVRSVTGLALASTLGFALGSVIRNGIALPASALLVLGLFCWELWAPSTPWLLLNPLHAALGPEVLDGVTELAGRSPSTAVTVMLLLVGGVLGMTVGIVGLAVLVLRPTAFEVLVGLLLVMFAAGALAVCGGWFLELLHSGGLWYGWIAVAG